MSTMSDYYCPGEEPAHDYDPPDYDEAFPPEEWMIEALAEVRRQIWTKSQRLVPLTFPHLDEILKYFRQAIAARDAPTPWECDHDTEAEFTDPFGQED
jgi:hypothetical protein